MVTSLLNACWMSSSITRKRKEISTAKRYVLKGILLHLNATGRQITWPPQELLASSFKTPGYHKEATLYI